MRKFLPILLISGLLFCFLYFHLYRYLSFESIALHQNLLLQWKDEHYLGTVLLYMLTYSLAVAASFPGVVFFSLLGGSTLLFLSVKLALAAWFEKKTASWLKIMEAGFRKNAFNYLLSLRLIPLFPFWLVNIISGLLALPLPIFISATFLGLIPGAIIYTSIGQNLRGLFEVHQLSLFQLLLTPRFLLPLLALAILALLPLLLGSRKRKPL
jgi:uncharacterized membrane protein YdjX (TVP38/TMEM64 family)